MNSLPSILVIFVRSRIRPNYCFSWGYRHSVNPPRPYNVGQGYLVFCDSIFRCESSMLFSVHRDGQDCPTWAIFHPYAVHQMAPRNLTLSLNTDPNRNPIPNHNPNPIILTLPYFRSPIWTYQFSSLLTLDRAPIWSCQFFCFLISDCRSEPITILNLKYRVRVSVSFSS